MYQTLSHPLLSATSSSVATSVFQLIMYKLIYQTTWSQYDAAYRDAQIKDSVLANLQAQLILEY